MECKCFLFDLDGTLIDSLPASEKIWTEWAITHHVVPDDVLHYIHGRQAIESLRYFLRGKSDEEIHYEWLELERKECAEVESITALPGALDILNFLGQHQIPWAIVTSGTPKLARARHAAAQLPMPNLFITAEHVKNSKPHPEPYLLAASRLGFEPAQCVVFEDAIAGIQSGLSAGCKVIAVNAPLDTKCMQDIDFNVKSIQQLSYNCLANGLVKVTCR